MDFKKDTLDNNNIDYDLPFGKASQTAKRFKDDSFDSTLSEECTASQDLFLTQTLDIPVEIKQYQGKDIFSPETRSQLGIKCGKTVVRSTKECSEKFNSRTQLLPCKYVSIEKQDLPHPKQLFKKKRRKRLEATKHIKKDTVDVTDSVHGHLQQLKVKIANRKQDKTDLFKHEDEEFDQTLDFPKRRKIASTMQESNESLSFESVKSNDSTVLSPKSRTWNAFELSTYQKWMTSVPVEEE